MVLFVAFQTELGGEAFATGCACVTNLQMDLLVVPHRLFRVEELAAHGTHEGGIRVLGDVVIVLLLGIEGLLAHLAESRDADLRP